MSSLFYYLLIMNNRITSSFFVLALLVITIQSCEDDKLPKPSTIDCDDFDTVSFDADIQPIIDSKCAIVGEGGCHNGENGADLDWRVFNNFQSHASQVEDRVQRPLTAEGHMPKIGSITDDQIKLLVCWVRQGAKDN